MSITQTYPPPAIERLLVVGLGSIGRRHARLARQMLKGVAIGALRRHAGAVDPDLGEIECFTSLEQALAFRPQAAVIANPASQHLAVAFPLARAGVHLMIEKPLTTSSDGVKELIEVCARRNVILMVGYNLRFLRSLQCFRELIAANRVGQVLSVRAEVGQYLPSWRPQSDYRSGVSGVAALGGGVLLELSHELDYLRWVFGDIAWVSAVQLRQSMLEIDVEDTAHLTIGFAPRADRAPLVASLNLDFVRHDTTRCCIAIGESGSLRWDAIAGTVAVFEQDGVGWQTLVSEPQRQDESILAEWNHFLHCIAGQSQPLVTAADGLAIIRLVEAARRSSLHGMVVRLNSDVTAVQL